MENAFSSIQFYFNRSIKLLRICIVLFVMCFSNWGLAQNLVVNGDFENYISCPTNYAQVTKANAWMQPSPGTPDYYNTCSGNLSPYNNLAGYEPPYSGNGYAGIVLTNSTGAYREYVQTELTKPLLANRVYYFEMYVSLGDSCNYWSDKFGVHFSPDSVHSDSIRILRTPQITTLSAALYSKNGWTQITALYKATGGEKFITIGCFNETYSPNLTSYTGGGSTTGSFSNMTYYYIDNVSLIDPNCDSIPLDRINSYTINVCNNNQSFPKTLFPSHSGYTYLWGDSSKNTSYNANAIGQYWAYTFTNVCPYVDTFNLVYTPLPTIDLGADTDLCSSNSFTIIPKVQSTNLTYLWSNNSTNSTLQVNNNGTYWLKITNGFGCTNIDSITVHFNIIPNVLGNDIDMCSKSFPLKLSASAALANSYNWYSSSTDSFVYVNDTGNYWVRINKGTCSVIDTINVKNTILPNNLLGNDTLFCNGNSFSLSAPAADSYKWYFSSNQVTPTFSFISNNQNKLVFSQGLYLLEIKKNTCIKKDTIKLDLKNKPIVNIGNDTILCYNKTIQLNAFNSNLNKKYLWQNGDTNTSQMVSNLGIYWVKVSNDFCYQFDSIQIFYENEVKVNLGKDTTLCSNQVLVLNPTVTNALTYKWQNNSSVLAANIINTGTYWLEVAKGNCKARDSINVGFITLPTVNLGPDTIYCQGQSFTYKVSYPGASYLWNNNRTDSFLTANTMGTYWVEINNQGCKARDSVAVTIFPLEKLNLGNDTAICAGDTISLKAISTNATSYLWNTAQTTQSIKPLTTGMYWAEASASFCKVRDTIFVTFKPLPAVNFGNDTVICSNVSLVLDSKVDSAVYLWDNFSTNKTRTINNLGYYTVKVTKNGCSAQDGIAVTTENPPLLDLGKDTTLCTGYTLNLQSNISSVDEFLWQNNSTFSYFTVSDAGTYSLKIKKGICYVTDSIKVSYLNFESMNLGNDTNYCFNNPIVIKPQISATTYLWQDASNLDSFVVNNPGTYWVEINSATCKVRDTLILTQKTLPIIDLGTNKKACIDDTISLNAQNVGAEFIWEDLSTNQIHQVKAPGLFHVKVTNNLGCYAIDSIQLDTFPAFYTSLGKDTFVCQGGELRLQAEQGFKSYIWQDNSTSSNYTAMQSGKYFVTVKNENDCKASDTILLTQKPKPIVNLPNILKACEPDFDLNPGSHFINYLWNDGSTKSTLKVKDYGNYQVTVTDANYCENSAKTEVINYCEGKLVMPNAFTPNNDDVNDNFKPVSKNLQTINFKIFDRWGQLIFETSEINKGWDGKINSNTATSDVYFYTITYLGNNETSRTINGNFTLLR